MKILYLTVFLISCGMSAAEVPVHHPENPLHGLAPVETNIENDKLPVAHWLFDDPNLSTAVDLIDGHVATLINEPKWGEGWAGEQFVHLDKDSQAIEIPMDKCRPESGTVVLRIWPEAANVKQLIFGHALDSIENRIALALEGDSLAFRIGESLATGIARLNPDQPYHIAFSWDGPDYAVFVNGEHKASGAFAGLTRLDAVAYVGNYASLDSPVSEAGFCGLVEDIQLYSYALDKKAIQDLFMTHYVKENRLVEFVVVGYDPDGNRINYTAHNLPQNATFDFETQTFSWKPF